MKSLIRTIYSAPKLSGLFAMLLAVLAVPAAILAWGPDRPTFTVQNPAPYVTFNSMTDNPVVGDERNFVAVKDSANTQDGGWKDTITVEPGKEYLVRVYVHNNASENLNLVAENTRVTAAIGTNTGTKVGLTGYVSADNANPKQVYDDVHFVSDDTFNMAYVPGSAKLYNNVTGQAGRSVSDSIVNGGGAQIGYESNNGKIPGCFKYVAYVTFKVKPQFAEKVTFTTEKSVRKNGESQWHNTLNSQAGDTVQYRVLFQNTSNVQLNNIVVRDQLPKGVTYVNGSTRLYLASNPSEAKTMPDGIAGNGLNIGSYGRNGLASVIFDAKVSDASKLKCGTNSLRNVATVYTDYGQKSDDAIVTVTKECEEQPEKPEQPKPEMVKVCDPKTGDIISVEESDKDNYRPVDAEECKDEEKKKTPVVNELPKTGAGSLLLGVLGITTLSTAAYYYVSSRRI